MVVGCQHRWWGGSGRGHGRVVNIDGGWWVVDTGGVVVVVAGHQC